MVINRGKIYYSKVTTLKLERCFFPSFLLLRSYTTTKGSDDEERMKKIRALFGVTTAGKPAGTPIVTIKNETDVKKDGEEEKVIDEGEAAKKAWLESGYVEYMDNQRDKGWKS
jgi:hypothetical protein